MEMRAPKGVFDIYPDAKETWQNSSVWQLLEGIFRKQAAIYNFKEVRTPLFEHLDLFTHGVGEGSDIVSKEMYSFKDKGGRDLALRPEGTAAVIRAYLEHKLYALEKTSKFFYIAPMFRYERQQAGRYRQHHQFGAEALGISSPFQDVEMIDLAFSLYSALEIKNLKLLINCVGSLESRKAYSEALKDFLEPKFQSLSEDSQIRFHKNRLRILDSKDPKDQALLEGAPHILDFLDTEKRDHFQTVLGELASLGIDYELTPKLVRGLDYYDSTVFEIVIPRDEGFMTIGGGGRYDGLIPMYNSMQIPAVGFGTGLERIIQTVLAQNQGLCPRPDLDAYIIPMENKALPTATKLAHTLRAQGLKIDIELAGRKIKAALPFAESQGACYALIIGEEELASHKIKIKHLSTRTEIALPYSEVSHYFNNPHK